MIKPKVTDFMMYTDRDGEKQPAIVFKVWDVACVDLMVVDQFGRRFEAKTVYVASADHEEDINVILPDVDYCVAYHEGL